MHEPCISIARWPTWPMKTGDATLLQTCKRLWQHLSTKRLFLTGGIGSSMLNEGFSSEGVFGDAVTVFANAIALGLSDWGNLLYRRQPPGMYTTTLKAIPYYLWCNRGASTMRVWMHEQIT
jgi:DUF1680 family protein